MPYTDANGTIMIDEVAAASDISKMKASRDKFSEALDAIQQVLGANSEMAGGIKDSLDESLLTIAENIRNQITMIDNMTAYIDHVVDHYKVIDQGLKGTIDTVL